MGLNLGASLTTEEKRILLQQSEEECKISLYRVAIASGVDPDDLDFGWEPGPDAIEEPAQQLFRELKKLQKIQTLLAALPAE